MTLLQLLLTLSVLISGPTAQKVPQPQCKSYSLAEYTKLQNTLKEREVQCVPLDLITEMSGEEIDELAREFSFLNIAKSHRNWEKNQRIKYNKDGFSMEQKISEVKKRRALFVAGLQNVPHVKKLSVPELVQVFITMSDKEQSTLQAKLYNYNGPELEIAARILGFIGEEDTLKSSQ